MGERIVWMQDVHITLTCPPEQVRQRAENYEQMIATIALLDWGFSYKREQGYIVLEWEGQVGGDFLACLAADDEVEDYCVYDVPCVAVDEEVRADES